MHKLRLRVRWPSPALVVSLLTVFVTLTGTAYAAGIVPLAKRALTADTAKVATTAKSALVAANALKLNGQTAPEIAQIPGPATTLEGQTAAQIAATPGPASSIIGLLTIRSQGFSIQSERDIVDARALCNSGERAVGGGFDIATSYANVIVDRSLPDGSGWWLRVWALSGDDVPAHGSVWVICST